MKRRFTFLSVLALLGATPVMGQFKGEMDADFGTSGRLWFDYQNKLQAQASGKMVVDQESGSIFISGSTVTDGSIDAFVFKVDEYGQLSEDFGEKGSVVFGPIPGLLDRFEAVAVQQNGKIIGGGYNIPGIGNSDLLMARFNTDGEKDNTFSEDGMIMQDLNGGLDAISDIVLQEDGKLLVTGGYQVSQSDFASFVFRYNSDGSLDGTFGTQGVVSLNFNSGFELMHALQVLSTGNIMLTGEVGDDVQVVVLDADGQLETDFSIDGSVNFKINSKKAIGTNVVELPDGNVLIAGHTVSEKDSLNGFAIKLNSKTGNVETDFVGIDGLFEPQLETEAGTDTTFWLRDVQVLSTGEILLVGDYQAETQDVGMFLLTEKGELVADFGDNGFKTLNLSGGSLPNANVQIEAAADGAVYLSADVKLSETNTDVVVVKLESGTIGIGEENKLEINSRIYPNPAQENACVEFTLEQSTDLTVTLVDLTGKLVWSNGKQQFGKGTHRLPMALDIPAGYYLVRFEKGNLQSAIPLIKQ